MERRFIIEWRDPHSTVLNSNWVIGSSLLREPNPEPGEPRLPVPECSPKHPDVWPEEFQPVIVRPLGTTRIKLYPDCKCAVAGCGLPHPTTMHMEAWNYLEVWVPKCSKRRYGGGGRSDPSCSLCTAIGIKRCGHNDEDHGLGEWRDHPSNPHVDYQNDYSVFARPLYNYRLSWRPLGRKYFFPERWAPPRFFRRDFPDVPKLLAGLWWQVREPVNAHETQRQVQQAIEQTRGIMRQSLDPSTVNLSALDRSLTIGHTVFKDPLRVLSISIQKLAFDSSLAHEVSMQPRFSRRRLRPDTSFHEDASHPQVFPETFGDVRSHLSTWYDYIINLVRDEYVQGFEDWYHATVMPAINADIEYLSRHIDAWTMLDVKHRLKMTIAKLMLHVRELCFQLRELARDHHPEPCLQGLEGVQKLRGLILYAFTEYELRVEGELQELFLGRQRALKLLETREQGHPSEGWILLRGGALPAETPIKIAIPRLAWPAAYTLSSNQSGVQADSSHPAATQT